VQPTSVKALSSSIQVSGGDMKEKQEKGILRCVQASAGDIEISEKQNPPSLPEITKRSKVSALVKKDVSKPGGSTSATIDDRGATVENAPRPGSADTNPDEEVDGNPRRRIKNLAGFWSAAQTDDSTKSFRKKRFHVDEGPVTAAEQGDELERIQRSDDVRGAEQKPQIEINEGHAKGIANMFLNRSTDSAISTNKSVRLGREFDSLEDDSVVPNVDNTSAKTSSSVKLRRRIKDMAGTFSSTSTDDDTQSVNEKKIATFNTTDAESNTGSQGEPVVLEKKRTRGLADRWQQQQLQQEQEATAARSGADDGRTKPAWLIELEIAKELEPVVYENEPLVRDDVIRADDETTDVISARVAREARQMWSTIEKDEKRKKEEPAPVGIKSKATAEVPQSTATTSIDDKDASEVIDSDSGKENIEQKKEVLQKVLNVEDKEEKKYQKDELEKKEQVEVGETDDHVESVCDAQASDRSINKSLSDVITECHDARTVSRHSDDDDDASDDDALDVEDDEYVTDDESGLILSGAELKYIPRRKLVHALRN